MKILEFETTTKYDEARVTFTVSFDECRGLMDMCNKGVSDFGFHPLIKLPILSKADVDAMKLVTRHIAGKSPKKSPEMKVIFNPPATILIMPDGKKYVSKVYNENFDPEKGLLMCLAKANGITHLGLKKMIRNGKHPDYVDPADIKEMFK